MSDSIKKLAELFTKFPTVGRRTASRFVFYLINLSQREADELIEAIRQLKSNVKLCDLCFQPQEGADKLCSICSNPTRDGKLLCVVEKESDLISLENTQKYKGLYFILGGTVTFRNSAGAGLRIKELQERIKGSPQPVSEVIMATNPTPEGLATGTLAERSLKELPQFSAKITHLAKGLPVGGELEYADPETLESAFDGRKEKPAI